ncbi:hypothetical protein CI109_104144 [Kwoniella shandongensis]|uniref:Uncharacterized protein n=1 Tax=Kwoniella shandongensis TaxID=1734106 RepID=A0A5M6C1A5_9TREE|nr:uncharacterized protein CI109_002943 [Kwoniella shandongensis]KAA5528783.1 hypothetical protein CI109_002943 [Kwoniella shandongensis]
MIFPPSTSFTPLSTVHLPTPHLLHPKSCNPAMDLLVLLSSVTSPASASIPAFGRKGKEKEVLQKTKVGLWRTGGSKVWEVEVGGRVAGLAWSEDGLILSVLLLMGEVQTVDHLSVHSGEVIRSIPIQVEVDVTSLEQGRWVDMEWTASDSDWEKPKNGSALMIIDSLPRVTPVEPPKPANVLPFMRAAVVAPPKPTIHPNLLTFPALLPANPPVPPSILRIASTSLLTGLFPLFTTSVTSPATLSLAKVSNKIMGYLDVVLRGLENAEAAFREGEKQTMICREDLETCAQQQATTIPDVHADLFRFLMTGRSGVAVSEWLGSRLTGRTIAKWDLALDTSFRTIQKLVSESISPALERIILLLEELRGWARTPQFTDHLNLDEREVQRALDLVCGFAKLAEKMRRNAEHEMLAAAEFMKWVKYEIARSAVQDRSQEDLPLATHDLKLVWSFLQNGFVHSVFHRHLPYLLIRPPKDLLPEQSNLYPRSATRPLDEVIKETTESLNAHHTGGKEVDLGTPSLGNEGSVDSSADMSMSMSMSMAMENEDEDGDGDRTPTKALSEAGSRASSPDTVERRDEQHEEEVKRFLEEEPWVWANTVVQACEDLIKGAIGSSRSAVEMKKTTNDIGMTDIRRVAEGRWTALVPSLPESSFQQLWLLYQEGSEARVTAFSLSDEDGSAVSLALQFFDDEELVLLLESGSDRYLVTVRYGDLLDEMTSVPPELGDGWKLDDLVQMGQASIESIPSIPIARCRQLESRGMMIDDDEEKDKRRVEIALNGRKGRRLGCVLMEEGREVEVLDLEADEDEEDDEEEEEMEEDE